MKIFHIILLVGICALISMGTFFSGAIFSSMSLEGNSTHEAETVQTHENVSAWSYIIGLLLIVATIIAGLKLFREQVP